MVSKLNLRGTIQNASSIFQTSHAADADPERLGKGAAHFLRPWTKPSFRKPCSMSLTRAPAPFREDPIALFARAPCGWTPDCQLLELGEEKETMAKPNGQLGVEIANSDHIKTTAAQTTLEISIIACDRKLIVAI
jgi:hypothetical protein